MSIFTKSKATGNNLIFWACGASGAAGLIYQVIWFRALTNTIGATNHSFSILVAAFLAGLALGGHRGGVYAGRNINLIRTFGLLELGTAVFGTAVFYVVNHLGPVYSWLFYGLRESVAAFTLAQMTLVFLLLLVPATLMGANFPIVVKIWSERRKEAGRNAGDVYAVNTWGSVFGSMAAGFLLVPLVGLEWSVIAAASINISLAVLAFSLAGFPKLAFWGARN